MLICTLSATAVSGLAVGTSHAVDIDRSSRRYGSSARVHGVPAYRLREAANLLGVSDDTVRRWADGGRLPTVNDASGRRIVDGAVLAHFAEQNAAAVPETAPVTRESARNRFVGIVTRVVRDRVMAQVEMQCGPYRVVSLMSREAADELRLEPGVTAVAAVKSTNVVVEISTDVAVEISTDGAAEIDGNK